MTAVPAAVDGSTDPALRIERLSAGYGQQVVTRDVDLVVHPGEIVALLGPNGAGKSTTLLTVSGLAHMFAGAVSVDGVAIDHMTAHLRPRAGVAHVPEDRSLFFGLTVDENLRLVTSASQRPAYEVFPELVPLKSRRAGLLSGGEQQMLAIGRALEASPAYLMIDEMSMGLAPTLAQRVMERLVQIAQERNVGVLLVEQNVDLALRFADRVNVLVAGEIRFSGSRDEALAEWSSVREAYFS